MSFDRQCPKCLAFLDTLQCDVCGLVDLRKCPEARIAKDHKKGYTVYTSHLGDTHGSDTNPLWYETMITTPCGDFMEYQERCETRIEAMKMHQDALDYLERYGPPKWNGWRRLLGLK